MKRDSAEEGKSCSSQKPCALQPVFASLLPGMSAATRSKDQEELGSSSIRRQQAPFLLPRFKLKYKICIQSPQGLAQ